MPNSEVVRHQAEAFERGEHDAVLAAFTDDAVFHYPGRGPLGGSFRGRDEIQRFLHRRDALLEGGSLEYDIAEFTGVDERDATDVVIEVGRARGRRPGKELAWDFVGVSRMRHGKVAEARTYVDDQVAVDKFWS